MVTLGTWVVMLKIASIFRLVTEVGPGMFIQFVQVVWFILCATNAVGCLRASHASNSYRKYFLGFAHLQQFGGAYICPLQLKKAIWVATVVSWLLLATNVFALGMLAFTTPIIDTMLADPIPASATMEMLICKVFAMIICVYVSAAWTMPMIFELAMAYMIYREFHLFRQSFRAKVK